MALQVIYVNDAAPGACGDAGIVYDGDATLTTSHTIAGAAMTLSSTADITGNTSVGGTLEVTGATTQTGALGCAASITLGAGADLIGSATSDITINTDKFTVAGATGNTVVAGTCTITGALTQTGAVGCAASITLGAGADLIGSSTSDITINTDKFTVAGATGNTVIAGTCTITGALTQTGAVGCAASITLGAGADLIGSSTSDITINTDKFTVAGATGNTVVAGTLGVTGASTHSAAMIMSADEVAATHGAVVVSVANVYSGYTTDSTSAIAATLADGTDGQLKIIKLTTKDTNNMVVTPDNLTGGATLTFDATGEYAILMFVDSAWVVIATSATLSA